MARIDIDQLASAVMTELNNFRDVTVEKMEKAVRDTAKMTVAELRTTSPVGATGDYSQSWKSKRDRSQKGKYRFDMVVYSEKPDYRLTHLLEKGHALRRGGRKIGKVNARPHIQAAEQHAIEMLEERLLSDI